MWHIYLGAVTLGLSVLMINLLLNLRALHRLGSEKGKLPDDYPLISILVPARNEERDIVPCVESLRLQDYPAFEILVLDDNSTDRTAEKVAEIAAKDPRVKLIRGEPLPPGWAGKPHACHQLAATAKGSWLLFTDADTIHAPDMLISALTYALAHKLSLISGFPFQKTSSFSQRVVMPAMWSIVMTCVPLWWVQGARRPKAGLVIGQFIFVNAADYHEVGGHEAVKGTHHRGRLAGADHGPPRQASGHRRPQRCGHLPHVRRGGRPVGGLQQVDLLADGLHVMALQP